MSGNMQRLDGISTMWSIVCTAHDDADGSGAREARAVLVQRYGGAARRYLLAACRDRETAEELFQEFSIRVLEGRLSGADREKGKFRSFVKGVLFNLIREHARQAGRGHSSLSDSVIRSLAVDRLEDDDETLRESWRQELFHQSWLHLESVEARTGQPYCFVLRHRAENPGVPATEIARAWQQRSSEERTPESIRQLLHRAREKFSDHLLSLITEMLPAPKLDLLEEELIELGLLEQCRPALDRRRNGAR